MGPIRQRKALSCVDCRRRKVKCDRTLPICVRCQKNGNADNCNYVPHVGPNTLPTPSDDSPNNQREENEGELDRLIAPWDRSGGFHRAGPVTNTVNTSRPEPKPTLPSTNKELLARVIELETYVRSAGGRPVSAELLFGIGNPVGSGYQAERNPMSDYDKVMVRGQAFSTQYFGPSFSINLLLQFDELSKFVKDALAAAPELDEAKVRMAALRAQSKRTASAPSPVDHAILLRMVPDLDRVDNYVKLYMETFETTYRILHVPSFERDYAAFRENPEDSRSDFLVRLLLIIAIVYCIVPGGPSGYVGRSSAQREVAARWISACEEWLEEQSKKHMLLPHLQIHVLISLAKDMNCIKVKRAWATTGILVRLAMAAGMHREPSLLARKISAFDCEMRRRLWFTILEIDMNTTIDRGMTPTLDSFGYDCLPPRNIHDEEFDESTEILPSSRPRTEFTRTTWLHCMHEHLSLRMEILGRINSIRLVTDLEIVMQFDNKLRKVLDDLPTWKDEAAATANPLLRLVLYEFILILHVPLASQTPNKARFLYSVASKRDAAFKTLSLYSKMPDILRFSLIMRRDDHGRAALAICHDIVINLEEDALPNSDLTIQLLELCVEFLERRVRILGQGFHGFWITNTACELARWKLSGEESGQKYAKKAAARVIDLFRHATLANQVPMPALNGTPIDGNVATPSTTSMRNASVDGIFAGFSDATDAVDPMWDFMNFDFGSVWSIDPYSEF